MGGKDFAIFLKPFVPRLVRSFLDGFLDEIEKEHKDMRKLFARDPVFWSLVELTKMKTNFEDAWKLFWDMYPKLVLFLGGLGTVFSSTLLVEADFAMLKWLKDENSNSLTDFSLEGIMHVKQFWLLASFNRHRI